MTNTQQITQNNSKQINWEDFASKQYKEGDFTRISWEEYVKDMDKVVKEVKEYIQENNIKIDAVVPIMRGAAFLGAYLAYKLKLLRILPIQYHYFFVSEHKAELRQFLFTPKKEMFDHDKPVFLMVEGDQCYGNSVIAAAKGLKEMFPNCRILHAADCLDYSYRDSAKDYVEKFFYGRYTNNCEELSKDECEKMGITEMTLAPWENADEEIDTMSGKQPFYNDLEVVKEKSEKKAEFDF